MRCQEYSYENNPKTAEEMQGTFAEVGLVSRTIESENARTHFGGQPNRPSQNIGIQMSGQDINTEFLTRLRLVSSP